MKILKIGTGPYDDEQNIRICVVDPNDNKPYWTTYANLYNEGLVNTRSTYTRFDREMQTYFSSCRSIIKTDRYSYYYINEQLISRGNIYKFYFDFNQYLYIHEFYIKRYYFNLNKIF